MDKCNRLRDNARCIHVKFTCVAKNKYKIASFIANDANILSIMHISNVSIKLNK